MTETAPPSSMRRDVASAYAATAAKILSWLIVLGLVYRFVGAAEFAMLALIRGTIGVLNYTSLGLSPAMIRLLAETKADRQSPPHDAVLSYHTPEPDRGVQAVYANGLLIALLAGALGAGIATAYGLVFDTFYHMPDRLRADISAVVIFIGFGTVLRLMSDASGSILQSHQLIEKDNWLLVEAEVCWAVLCCVPFSDRVGRLQFIAICYVLTGGLLLFRRTATARQVAQLSLPSWRLIDEPMLKRLIGFGVLVLFAQLADYLYAPCDYILINLFLGWDAVATYTPAMTIDAGLLLLVSGLSSVILPRSAIAHTAGDMDRVRRYYVYGTLGSAFLLAFAAGVVWLLSPIIFRLWLGDPMKPTQAILPLVLIHTVVGGSSAVGRSILLGMGKVKPFTIGVLIAGVANVVLSYIFVRHLNLGLRGIIYGTIIVVVFRCLIWMPWYVLRNLDGRNMPERGTL
jgi:O-antigen/teichoic acid export membrane protein